MATEISPIRLYTSFLNGISQCKRPFKVQAKVQDFKLMVIFFWVNSLAPLEDKELDEFREDTFEDKSIKAFFKKIIREIFTHDPKPDLNSNDFDWSIFFITSPPQIN